MDTIQKSGSPKCILVIDDSPTVRAVVGLALRCEGHEITSFPDGVAALKWLAGPQAKIPDLAVIDIGLPELDGYQLIHLLKMRPRFAHTICIVLSAQDGTVNLLKGRLAGARMCLTKPCTVQTLCQAVRTCLAGESGPDMSSF
ncbi:MAG TPA: response regulator [Ktedonobacteraceae bacterium]|nr:response regulator [Ktedonobacteraceae bacterium]